MAENPTILQIFKIPPAKSKTFELVIEIEHYHSLNSLKGRLPSYIYAYANSKSIKTINNINNYAMLMSLITSAW